MTIQREKHGRGAAVRLSLSVLLFILATHWLAEALAGDEVFLHWREGHFLEKAGMALAVALLTVLSAQWLWSNRRKFLFIRTLRQYPAAAKKHLVMFVSASSPGIQLPTDVQFPFDVVKRSPSESATESVSARLFGRSLLTDAQALAESKIYWNWEQLLRGLTPHVESLETLALIGSSDEEGSGPQLAYCKQFIQSYLPSVKISLLEPWVDFENFDEMEKQLTAWILRAEARGIRPRDIVVDVTGGKKTTSIVGAAATMKSQVVFQYVQMAGERKVLTFDVVVAPEMGE